MQQKIALEKNVKGRVTIGFTVSAPGTVANLKILDGNDKEAGFAALEIVKNMPAWTPGYQRVKAMPEKFLLPIEFK